jgi:hypothetical protein
MIVLGLSALLITTFTLAAISLLLTFDSGKNARTVRVF